MKPEDCIHRYGVSSGDEVYDMCAYNGCRCDLCSYDNCPEVDTEKEEGG